MPGSGNDLSGGLAKAVEMCNNNGHCRKFDAGTMCPSYRVTKDEQHVTRGRANTLRLAISGQLGEAGPRERRRQGDARSVRVVQGLQARLPDRRRHGEVQDRGARRVVKRHGTASARQAGRLHAALRAATRAACRRLMALADNVPVLSDVVQAIALGFAPRAALAALQEVVPGRCGAARKRSTGAGARRRCCCSSTPSTTTMEPENARAAQQVLEAAGYTVHFNTRQGERPRVLRPHVPRRGSRRRGEAGSAAHARCCSSRSCERGVPIVGLEPSCLLSLRDEFLHYGYGEEARRLSKQAFLFEEFLVRERKGRTLAADAEAAWPRSRRWCMATAIKRPSTPSRPVQTVLGWIPELKVSTIESSCCGMAGSFGYEAEHYEASQAMAELSLLPAVRKMRRQHARGRRRHELPASDPRRRRRRRDPCGARAGDGVAVTAVGRPSAPVCAQAATACRYAVGATPTLSRKRWLKWLAFA